MLNVPTCSSGELYPLRRIAPKNRETDEGIRHKRDRGGGPAAAEPTVNARSYSALACSLVLGLERVLLQLPVRLRVRKLAVHSDGLIADVVTGRSTTRQC